MDLPTFLQIEPVGQCNLRCEMCPIRFRNDGPLDGTPAFLQFDDKQALLILTNGQNVERAGVGAKRRPLTDGLH